MLPVSTCACAKVANPAIRSAKYLKNMRIAITIPGASFEQTKPFGLRIPEGAEWPPGGEQICASQSSRSTRQNSTCSIRSVIDLPYWENLRGNQQHERRQDVGSVVRAGKYGDSCKCLTMLRFNHASNLLSSRTTSLACMHFAEWTALKASVMRFLETDNSSLCTSAIKKD
jgi:hypothetical protein